MLRLFTIKKFAVLEKKLVPIFATLFPLLLSVGLYQVFFVSPVDYQQGIMVKIMYVHVPSAWISLGIYSFIAVCSILSLVWQLKLPYILSVAAAPVGATFSLITLVTGSIWGKPIWGTWWVWDARLTSMLILLLIYLSYIAIVNSGDSLLRAEKPACIVAIIGFINIPIIKFSVDIWYSLHQPSSVFKTSGPSIHSSMLLPLTVMFTGFCCFCILLLLMRTKLLLNRLKYNNMVR